MPWPVEFLVGFRIYYIAHVIDRYGKLFDQPALSCYLLVMEKDDVCPKQYSGFHS